MEEISSARSGFGEVVIVVVVSVGLGSWRAFGRCAECGCVEVNLSLEGGCEMVWWTASMSSNSKVLDHTF